MTLTHIGERFRAAAEVEANTPITVGASLADAGGRPSLRDLPESLALAKLIELRRRQCRLSVEELAARAGVDLDEVVRLAHGDEPAPRRRTVQRIAHVLQLPEQ